MALSIKSDEADRLAREVSSTTGESLTEAVVVSLRERLARLQQSTGTSMVERVRRLQREARLYDVADARTAEEILGYDDNGLPT